MPRRGSLLLTGLVVAACASSPARQQAARPASTAAAKACPALPDGQALLARHAQAFGSKDAVSRALPRSFTGETASRGKRGSVEVVLGGEGRFSQTTVARGMLSASGVDAGGPWFVGNAGVPVRLRADEAVDLSFGAWLQGRDYLTSFDPRRDAVACTDGAAGPRIVLRYGLPEVGNPELEFGVADAALLSVAHVDVNGHRDVLGFRGWSEADPAGVRWPLAIHLQQTSGSESLTTFTAGVPGLACPARPGEDCLAPPRTRLAFKWPGKLPVRVPAAFFLNEVLAHAKVSGRAVWGLLDSGATLNVIDSGSALASAFHPAAAEGSTPDQRSPFALGEIREAVSLGDLAVEHVPAAAVPMPSFDEFGARRPEMLIGYPLFLGAAVRLDYARQELLLASDSRGLHSASAIALPLKILGGSVVAEGTIDGVAGLFVLDTGDTEAVDLFKDWAERHGFPGSRPTFIFRQQSEVGSQQSDEKRMRPAAFSFGPIHLTGPLVAIDSVSSQSERIAGQVGNGVFARCSAVVFDIPERTLWLEPPCDRAVPEDLAGWTLERKDSAAYPDRPWVIGFVIAGGSADRAGLKAGDRLLELGGKPAALEIGAFEADTRQAAGTEVPAVVVRGDARRNVTLRLVQLLAHGRP